MKKLALSAALLASIACSAAHADVVKLKFAYFASDQSKTFLFAIKPFIDAVNAEGKGVIEVEAYTSGALGRDPIQQLHMLDDGTADIAFTVLGYTPERFPDNSLIELPGLFKSAREATLTFTRLIAAGKLSGYEDFYVIGAFGPNPVSIHMRPLAASLDDLKGKEISTNSASQAAALTSLGMTPVSLPLAQAADAVSSGKIDGSAAPPTALLDFGVGRVVTNHYLLPIAVSPLAVLMNRKTFDGLSPEAQAVIRKHSGEWLGALFIDGTEAEDNRVLDELKANPMRKVTVPSAADMAKAAIVFGKIVDDWQKRDPGNPELLKAAQSEIGKLRSTQ